MDWNIDEAVSYYKTQGAPKDQTVLISLLREVQRECGGSIPAYMTALISDAYNVKETFLLAIIQRIPSLHLSNTHCLELCAGPNCGKHTALAAYADKLHASSGRKFVLKYTPCMRMCGKGPNIKWDGTLFHKADEHMLQQLLTDAKIDF